MRLIGRLITSIGSTARTTYTTATVWGLVWRARLSALWLLETYALRAFVAEQRRRIRRLLSTASRRRETPFITEEAKAYLERPGAVLENLSSDGGRVPRPGRADLPAEGSQPDRAAADEICRIPVVPNQNGKIQLMSKVQMAKPPLNLPSPNLADALVYSVHGQRLHIRLVGQAHRVQRGLHLMVDIEELKGVIASEMENSVSDELVSKRKTAIDYYEGELPARPETVGRSGVVSTDVADSIEWLIPNIVESLNGRCVRFMPMSQMDEDQASSRRRSPRLRLTRTTTASCPCTRPLRTP